MNSSNEEIFEYNYEDLEQYYKFEVLDLKITNKRTHTTNYTSGGEEVNQVLSKEEIEENVIPFSDKVIYCLPSFTKMACIIILNIHAMLFYENLGTNLLLVSFFVTLARAVELIVKPIIAYISDRATFRMGRRKPFMLLGCVFYAFFLVAIFLPPKVSSSSNAIWFGTFYVLFFIADTVCNVPYLALGPEMSNNTKEREKLYIIFYVLQYFGVLFASAAPIIINRFINTCDCSFCSTPDLLNTNECVRKCQVFCTLNSNEASLIYICLSIGIFFISSIIILSLFIKEKKGSFSDEEKTYFIPSLFNLLNNQPFINVLIPWVIDTSITTIFSTMLPFFINIIINPQKSCTESGIELDSQICNTNILLGYCILLFFVTCILSMVIWHQLVVYYGKIFCWKSYSLVSIAFFTIFFACDEGSVTLLIFASFLTALPAGGSYLNEVIVTDIIDYDEFLTGKRNEATYTVFSSFIPKIVSIFSQAIPLSIITMMGFVSSENGVTKEQPQGVKSFIQFYFICLPILLAFISYLFKRHYPIHDEKMNEEVQQAIHLQKDFHEMQVKSSKRYDFYLITNPIYNSKHIHLFTNTTQEEQTKLVADHFPDKKNLSLLYFGKYNKLKKKLLCILGITGAISVAFFIVLIFTFRLLESKSMSSIPMISLFVFIISLTIFLMNCLRLSIANNVIDGELKIDKEFLRKYSMMIDYKINEHNLSMIRLSGSSSNLPSKLPSKESSNVKLDLYKQQSNQ